MQHYSRQVHEATDGEVGFLYSQLSDVLAQIREWEEALRQAFDSIEKRVAERTRELQQGIVERQRAERELQLAKQAAEKASRAKSEFLANIRHENGRPGTTHQQIGIVKSVLQQSCGGPACNRRAMRSWSIPVRAIIGDVLNFSRIEAGRLNIEPESLRSRGGHGRRRRTPVRERRGKGSGVDALRYAPNAPRRLIGDAGRFGRFS